MTKLYYGYEDFEKFYGFVNFKNKVVLDLGADYGSTTQFFLEKLAKKVISVESDTRLFKMLVEYFKSDNRVIPLNLLVTGKKIEELISKYHPDLVKIDIEGYEKYLPDADDKIFSMPREYIIETHPTTYFLGNNKISRILHLTEDFLQRFSLHKKDYAIIITKAILEKLRKNNYDADVYIQFDPHTRILYGIKK